MVELGAPRETFQDDASGRMGPGPGCVPAPAELRESCASLVVGVILGKLRSFAVWTESPWGSVRSHTQMGSSRQTSVKPGALVFSSRRLQVRTSQSLYGGGYWLVTYSIHSCCPSTLRASAGLDKTL